MPNKAPTSVFDYCSRCKKWAEKTASKYNEFDPDYMYYKGQADTYAEIMRLLDFLEVKPCPNE